MSEEKPKTTEEVSESKVTETPVSKPTQTTTSSGFEKLLIPGSIIVAGLLIGGGIFLSGGNSPSGQAGSAQPEPGVNFEDLITQAAEESGVDMEAWAACRAEDKFEDKIRNDFETVAEAGGRGTPFFVVTNGDLAVPFSGAQPYEQMQAFVNQVITGEVTVAPEAAEAAKAALPVLETDHVAGNPDAPITIIEYSDFQCPFCSRAHPTVARVVEESDGEINWVYRHFPLTNIHPAAYPASVASECVAELAGNDAFWVFTDTLFALQS